MRWFLLVFITICILFVGIMGFRGQKSTNRPLMVFLDMDVQSKVMPQKPSHFFANGMGSRKPVENTVPMGYEIPGSVITAETELLSEFPISDSYYSTGRFGDYYGSGFPENLTVDEAFLKRGEERYNVYCTVCHGESGNGKGPVGDFWLGGMLPPTANLVDGRVSALPDGQIYDTIANGKGLMGPYSGNITVPDRWAVVAWVRALQVSQKADLNDPAVKAAIEKLNEAPADDADAETEPVVEEGGDA